MSRYRRAVEPGGTFFLTLVTFGRARLFNDPLARTTLHDAIAATREERAFDLLQSVLLPDHLHLILRLPANDADVATRVASLKSRFTRAWLAGGGSEGSGTSSRRRQRYRGVWQKRFWEHVVFDQTALARCEAYVWFNPAKHGLARCPHDWPFSTFHREVRDGRMPADWCCACAGRAITPPDAIPGAESE